MIKKSYLNKKIDSQISGSMTVKIRYLGVFTDLPLFWDPLFAPTAMKTVVVLFSTCFTFVYLLKAFLFLYLPFLVFDLKIPLFGQIIFSCPFPQTSSNTE